jgi:hypothetical protein
MVRVAPLRRDVPDVGRLRLCGQCREGRFRSWRWRWRSLDLDLAPDFGPPERSGRLTGWDLVRAQKAAGVVPAV